MLGKYSELESKHKILNSEKLYIVKPKAACHITRQESINARASVQYPF